MSHEPDSVNELEAEEPIPVEIGEIIDGKFRVERVIGEGAIGLVVEATHIDLGERVAIKFLRPTQRGRTDQVTRFAREARAAARLNSEHVAHVIDVGALPNGDPYMVMELLEGQDLDQLLHAHGPILNIATAALYIIQACEALAEAHSVGIVHRDIKPANLFLVERPGTLPLIKLLDFGISKAALTGEYTDIVIAETKTTTIMGTPYYMAPEQVRSTKDVDLRADIWGIGAVLFELVSGKTVWRAGDLGTLVQEILAQDPQHLAEVRPDIDAGFAAVVNGALMRDPEKRYQTAAEFARALLAFAPGTAQVHVERAERFAKSTKQSVPLLWTGLAKEPAVATNGRPTDAAEVTPAPTSRFFAIAVGVAVLVLLGGATAVVAPRILTQSPAPSAAIDPPPQPLPMVPLLRIPSASPKPLSTEVAPAAELPEPATTTTPNRFQTAPARWPPAPAKAGVASAKAPVAPPVSVATTISDPTQAPKKPKPILDENPWQKGDKTKLDDLR